VYPDDRRVPVRLTSRLTGRASSLKAALRLKASVMPAYVHLRAWWIPLAERLPALQVRENVIAMSHNSADRGLIVTLACPSKEGSDSDHSHLSRGRTTWSGGCL
jgi:hypothetical protein